MNKIFKNVFILLDNKGISYWNREYVSLLFVLSADIGACESIMKKKTKQDFQELIKTEHGSCGGRARLLPMLLLPLLPAPPHPAEMLLGSFQLMLAGWDASSCRSPGVP